MTIIITTVGKETLDAIALGLNTNATIAKYLDVIPETIASRCARLRKQKILIVTNPKKRVNMPLIYSYTGIDYTVSDAVVTRNRVKDKPMKTYAETGENTFDSLNDFIYNKHYQY